VHPHQRQAAYDDKQQEQDHAQQYDSQTLDQPLYKYENEQDEDQRKQVAKKKEGNVKRKKDDQG
jgi:hypothetical protein